MSFLDDLNVANQRLKAAKEGWKTIGGVSVAPVPAPGAAIAAPAVAPAATLADTAPGAAHETVLGMPKWLALGGGLLLAVIVGFKVLKK